MNKTELKSIKKHERALWQFREPGDLCFINVQDRKIAYGGYLDWRFKSTQDRIDNLQNYIKWSRRDYEHYLNRKQNFAEDDMKIYLNAIEKAKEVFLETIKNSVNLYYCGEYPAMLAVGRVGIKYAKDLGLPNEVFSALSMEQNSWGNFVSQDENFDKYFCENEYLNLGGYAECMFKKMELDFQQFIEKYSKETEWFCDVKCADAMQTFNDSTQKLSIALEVLDRENAVREYFETTHNEQELVR